MTSGVHIGVRQFERGDELKQIRKGAQGSFSTACTRYKGELACHIVQSGKYIALSTVCVSNM